MERKWPEMKTPKEWEKKDIYKPVFLNRYGYYELRKQNTPEERGKNFEKNYFQNYAGQTYAKQSPENELAFIKNKIEERELVIRENLEKQGCVFLNAERRMIPTNTVEVTDPETAEKVQKLLDWLDDYDDVQDVYHNVDLPDDEE